MIFLAAILLFIAVVRPKRALPLVARVAVVAVVAGLITSYFWLPFLRYDEYLNISPYLERWKYDSLGGQEILWRLLSGDLYDRGRLPVFTTLLALGLASGVVRRTRPIRLAMALLVVWLVLYFGRVTFGKIIDLLPMHEGLLTHRFVGAVDFAAILLVGAAGEWLWERFILLREPWRTAAPAAIVGLLMIPAFIERFSVYRSDGASAVLVRSRLGGDKDLATIIDLLKTLPPGRAYAGLRSNWGDKFKVGGVHMWDILTFNEIQMVEPPYQGLSMNADIVFSFNDRALAQYQLFNVRYVVAPADIALPSRLEGGQAGPDKPGAFLKPIKRAGKYMLYGADTTGFGEIARSMLSGLALSDTTLLAANKVWLEKSGPESGRFVRWSFAPRGGPISGVSYVPGSGRGSVSDELIRPGVMKFKVNSPDAALLVIKTSYHPKWRVTIDGKPAESFMTSPAFIGVQVPAGAHEVLAEYVSGPVKMMLLAIGALALIGAIVFRRRFERFEAIISRLAARG